MVIEKNLRLIEINHLIPNIDESVKKSNFFDEFYINSEYVAFKKNAVHMAFIRDDV
jgi:hypothetical protein